ncbi:MAG: YfiR family protein [Bacteroidales bacterium]
MIPKISIGQYQQFKALYVYNFTKRIEWPKNVKEGSFIIGVYGDSDIIKGLEKIAESKTVVYQKIDIQKYTSLKDIRFCHILYISKSRAKDTEKICEVFKNQPCLIISEKKSEVADISFIEDSYSLKFNINKESIQRKKLRVQSSLLNLSTSLK